MSADQTSESAMSVGVLAITVDTLIPIQLFPEEGREAITVVIVFLLLLGIAAIYMGYRTRQEHNRLKSIAVTEPGQVIDGPVAIEGIALAAADHLERPTGGGNVLAYEVQTKEIETRWVDTEAARTHDTSRKSQEQHVSRTTRDDAVPFVVAGETGTVRVDPTETVRLELIATVEHTEEVDSDDLADVVVERERHERISLLEDGDEVFVFGHAARADDADVDAVVGPDEEIGELIVSTKARQDLLEQYASNAPIAIMLGLVVAVGSFVVLVYEYVFA